MRIQDRTLPRSPKGTNLKDDTNSPQDQTVCAQKEDEKRKILLEGNAENKIGEPNHAGAESK